MEDLTVGWFGKAIAIVIGIQLILRGIGEGLTKISLHTEAKWDNKAAKQISQAAWWIGTTLGKFGYGVPKEVAKKDNEGNA